jgi:hypothetical protein
VPKKKREQKLWRLKCTIIIGNNPKKFYPKKRFRIKKNGCAKEQPNIEKNRNFQREKGRKP